MHVRARCKPCSCPARPTDEDVVLRGQRVKNQPARCIGGNPVDGWSGGKFGGGGPYLREPRTRRSERARHCEVIRTESQRSANREPYGRKHETVGPGPTADRDRVGVVSQ